jgi:hypothetical protein
LTKPVGKIFFKQLLSNNAGKFFGHDGGECDVRWSELVKVSAAGLLEERQRTRDIREIQYRVTLNSNLGWAPINVAHAKKKMIDDPAGGSCNNQACFRANGPSSQTTS